MKKIILVSIAVLTQIIPARAVEPEEIMKKSSLASHYAGKDRKSRMALLVYHKSVPKPSKKIFTLLRKDINDGGKQKYLLYFTYPREIKKASFLVHKYIVEDDYRRLFLPASNTVLMISGHQKQCAFMGSDFSSEDITGRHHQKDRHQLLGNETITISTQKGEKKYDTYLVESIPKIREDKTSKTRSWIDQKTYLPVKIEFYNHENQLYKFYEVLQIRSIDGYSTVVKHRMTSPLEGTHTILILDLKNTRYNLGVNEDIFVEASLYKPPEIVLN
ncbi:MAG: outer membrane lipoprotein-sorting protein [Proteobacteria bacterium]|nr:outer membrane lipoprotein-sorting protein [Pseudomonadota bacterium]